MSNYYSKYSTILDVEVGGTALGEALQSYYIERYGIRKHSTYDELMNASGGSHLSNYFKFAIVRNPYDRAVSSFTFLRKWNGWQSYDQQGYEEIGKTVDVNDFIGSDLFSGEGIDGFLNPQAYWVGLNPNADDTNLEIKVDYIGKVENLLSDLNEINLQLGILDKVDGDIGVENSSRDDLINADTNLSLNETSIAIINEKYKLDFEYFAYDLRTV